MSRMCLRLLSVAWLLIGLGLSGCGNPAQQASFKKIRELDGRIEFRGNGTEIFFTDNKSLTNDDLACLDGAGSVFLLFLKGTNITDPGLDHVLKLDGLKQIDVNDTKITEQGIAKLKQKFPNLEARANVFHR